jgi:hypothetical protein
VLCNQFRRLFASWLRVTNWADDGHDHGGVEI